MKYRRNAVFSLSALLIAVLLTAATAPFVVPYLLDRQKEKQEERAEEEERKVAWEQVGPKLAGAGLILGLGILGFHAGALPARNRSS